MTSREFNTYKSLTSVTAKVYALTLAMLLMQLNMVIAICLKQCQ